MSQAKDIREAVEGEVPHRTWDATTTRARHLAVTAPQRSLRQTER